MATFVLVHGAWRGGWAYNRVAERLRAKGHRVFNPTLTGLGERSHLLSHAVNLTTHVDDVLNVIKFEELEGVVLAGHSYGGMVITGVAERAPEGAIASIVYLDAFLPEDGMSLTDYAPPEHFAAWQDHLKATNNLSVPPIPAAAFNANEADRDWIDRMGVPHPFATMTEKVRVAGKRDRIPKKAYVLATGYEGAAFRGFAAKAEADPAWAYYEIPCGHDLMLAMPDRTAEILEACA